MKTKKKSLRSDLIRVFCQKVGEDKKKKKKKTGPRSDLISVFCQKVGEDQKKKKQKKDLRSNLIGVLKKGLCGIFLQLTTSARKHQSTNQRKNLWWAILKPLAGHFWPAGGGLDALGIEHPMTFDKISILQ